MTRYVVLTAVAAIAIGCGRAPDTEENVRKALDQANMQAVQVAVDNDANIVHLKGTVETIGDRTRAEEVASATVGTTGRVLNELTVKGLNDETAGDLDDEIDDALDRTVNKDPVLKERDIDFRVVNGMVTITGEVASAAEKARVEQLAKAAPGVKDVANGLEIKLSQ
jgi:hyperosmotically inducible periplasmic protein